MPEVKWHGSRSVLSDSLQPHGCILPGSSVHGILQARILEWVSCCLLQGIFLTQGLNPGLLHCRWILYQLSHQGSLICLEVNKHRRNLDKVLQVYRTIEIDHREKRRLTLLVNGGREWKKKTILWTLLSAMCQAEWEETGRKNGYSSGWLTLLCAWSYHSIVNRPHSKVKCVCISCIWLFATPWTVACQAHLSMEFPRQNARVDCHFFLQGIFPTQEIKLGLLHCRQILDHLNHQGIPPPPQKKYKY